MMCGTLGDVVIHEDNRFQRKDRTNHNIISIFGSVIFVKSNDYNFSKAGLFVYTKQLQLLLRLEMFVNIIYFLLRLA